MNVAPLATRTLILRSLTDGMSVRGTARLVGCSKGTVLRLLAEVGEFCVLFMHYRFRKLTMIRRIEADEQWSFVGAKEKNKKEPGQGDAWVFCAIDADTKLVFSWLVGVRDHRNTQDFMADIASRLGDQRVQITTDGFRSYPTAIRAKLYRRGKTDYAQLVKTYGQSMEAGPQRRYSPMVCTGATRVRRMGFPNMDRVSTSYVERLNLNTRQQCRRFTRLTNAFSKKYSNHVHAVALHFFAHNYIRPHGTLSKTAGKKTSPAMAAGLTDHLWGWDETLQMTDARQPIAGMPGA